MSRSIKVGAETHVTGAMEFKNEETATIMMSVDLWDPVLPRIEIDGTEGALCVDDDDPYGGPTVFVRKGSWLDSL